MVDEQQYLCYVLDEINVLEIEKGFHYAVESRSERGVYRNVRIKIGPLNVVQFECDCASGFYRGLSKKCYHKTLVSPLVFELTKTGWFNETCQRT